MTDDEAEIVGGLISTLRDAPRPYEGERPSTFITRYKKWYIESRMEQLYVGWSDTGRLVRTQRRR